MTIDINELRRLAKAAMTGPDGVSLNWVKLLQDFQKEANPAVINELLDRLEQARLNGVGASREATLMAKLEAAEKEREALRIELNEIRYGVAVTHDTIKALQSKVEEMEKQEPVKIQHRAPFVNSNGELVGYSVWIDGRGFDHWPHRSLYALPGAKGEEK